MMPLTESAATRSPHGIHRVAVLSLHTSPLEQPGAGDAGGMNVYVAHLCRQLRELGMAVDVFTRVPASQPARSVTATPGVAQPHVIVHHLPAGPDSATKDDLYRFVPEISQQIRDFYRGRPTPDAIHSHYWISGLAGLEVRRDLGAPLIHTMHTLARVKMRDDPSAREPAVRVRAEDRLAAEADVLTANTSTECAELHELYHAPSGRVAVVPPGVDRTVFTPHGPSRWLPSHERWKVHAGRHSAPQPPLRIVFAGRLQPLKGPQLLLEALSVAARMAPQERFEVALIGHPSGAHTLRMDRLLPGPTGPVRAELIPPVPATELAAWFRGADLVAVPSFSESFGLVAAEAQACGTPVLANRVGGLKHVVDDGATGQLLTGQSAVQWARWLVEVARDRSRLQLWGKQAALHAHRFDWAASARELARLYRVPKLEPCTA
ncbi:glycosyltransferase [Zhihengliuella flava]|uniref:D-inositol 3-phosphate glycosyltransferase n=1 Tax=Zhihengliuella flava TaxID=1285193 RepID=A0A931GMV2_9MICC|nr:glycosyltransferase [Zhihengliuella flava]MBG6085789.1 D-inositol-3-phosphate glycosyltransferase [Zhihengliuella flava]